MRILITGGQGMLGRTLAKTLDGEHEVFACGRRDCDVENRQSVAQIFRDVAPRVVLHCAAMTDVDGCEHDPQAAWSRNAVGAANVAAACEQSNVRLIAFSTDYVFDGDSPGAYSESDPVNPQSVYGASKLAGEIAVRLHCSNHLILRIAWLYGKNGPSFVHALHKLLTQDSPPLKVVDDQRGNPTSCDAVAYAVGQLLGESAVGTWHLTCQGETNRFQWAREIAEICGFQREIIPCSSDEFPRPARRPANSCLKNVELKRHGYEPLPHWKLSLEQFLISNFEVDNVANVC